LAGSRRARLVQFYVFATLAGEKKSKKEQNRG
jgi:hypothetical protein